MRVDADVSHSARDAAVSPVDDVLVVHYVLLGQTQVDDVDRPIQPQSATPDDEVLRLDVAVDQPPRVDRRKSIHLNSHDRFYTRICIGGGTLLGGGHSARKRVKQSKIT